MAIISHDYKDLSFLEHTIIQKDGSPLYGEIDMYRRIYKDCENSPLIWHFWHDLRLPIPVGDQSEIQIDFFLACEKGGVVVEVKGGKVGIDTGIYFLEKGVNREYLKRSPFDQANDYENALFNNKVLDRKAIFVTTVCAFPHTRMNRTSENDAANQGWKLWSKSQQEDNNASFATFCEKVLEQDKQKTHIYRPDLSHEEVEKALRFFFYNFNDNNSYSIASIESIIEWLKVDNLRLFNSLRKNKRLVIEGGPGTGKTTLAKAFIAEYKDYKGLYVCWNKLLEAKIKNELANEGLGNCEVIQYASLLLRLQKQLNKQILPLDDINNGDTQKIAELLTLYKQSDDFVPYNYIIIDEAQDILDKGAEQLLQKMSFYDNGIETGSYMIFYDIEQGYNNENRNINYFVDRLARYSTHFILDENKRVPTNRDLITCAQALISSGIQVSDFLTNIESEYITVERFSGTKSLMRAIEAIRQEYRQQGYAFHINNCVLLAHSSTRKSQFGESLYDHIATSIGISNLDEQNISNTHEGIPFTSILKYKGLESKHVVLLLNAREYVDKYELYIGLSRAIIDVKILILE